MNYGQARAYAVNVSRSGSILGLDSIENLMHELGDIQEQLKIIHIAGTNGKGSTGAYLERVLIEAGYRVGRYSSPAVFDPMEVWRINLQSMSHEEYADIMEQVKCACDRMVEKGMEQPTIFEVETAMAFLYFYQKKCDYVLLEVGMGGRTDATNVIRKPVCSVITSVSMDHMQFLGNTLTEIAQAKAGIIKKDCPVVTILQKAEVMVAIEAEAEKQAAILRAEAEKEKMIREAEGEAEAILKVQQANADGIRFLKEAGADESVLTLKSLEALKDMAEGKATKIIVPSDLQGLAGLATSLKEIMTDKNIEKK